MGTDGLVEMSGQGWGVLHEWLEDDDVHSYVVGPFPSPEVAESAMAALGCDCMKKVIDIKFPPFVTMALMVRNVNAQEATGSEFLPDRVH